MTQLPSKQLLLAGLIALASVTGGCARFSQASRQQAAYARYVAKCSHTKVKQQAKFKKVKVPAGKTSAPLITTGTVDGPQAASSSAQ